MRIDNFGMNIMLTKKDNNKLFQIVKLNIRVRYLGFLVRVNKNNILFWLIDQQLRIMKLITNTLMKMMKRVTNLHSKP